MNNIHRLINYLQKQPQKPLDYTETSDAPTPTGGVMTPAQQTSTDLIQGAPKLGDWDDGGSAIPAQDRLYLVNGFIPGSESDPKTPEDLGIQAYKGIEKKDAQFVNKQTIHTKHKNLLDTIHPNIHPAKGFGGIVMNADGQILLRSPKGEGYGNRWTLPKGGADGGEAPSEAALREVLEETGITGKILTEVPGHYNANSQSNKFWVMTVDSSVAPQPFKGASEGKEETSAIKWVSLKEAMELLEEDYEGKNHEAADRDIQAIRAAHREWTDSDDDASMFANMEVQAQTQTQTTHQIQMSIVDWFVEHGELPDLTSPKYLPLINDVGAEFIHPGEHGTPSYGHLKELMHDMLRKVDQQRGHTLGQSLDFSSFSDINRIFSHKWAGDSLKTARATNMLSHSLAAVRGYSESYMYGHEIPDDVDVANNRIYRTDALRDEMIAAYDAWEKGESDGKGFFSNGEKYNFNNQKARGLMTTIQVDQAGELVEKQVESWDFVIERARATKDVKEAVFKTSEGKDEADAYREAGTAYFKQHKEEEPKEGPYDYGSDYDKQLIAAGKKFIDEATQMAYNITQGFLAAVFGNDVHHLLIWRKFNNPREILGNSGERGTKTVTEAHVQQMGMPTKANEKAGTPGFGTYMRSGNLTGGSTHPAWGDPPGEKSTYHAVQRTNLKDIFLTTSLGLGLTNEREIVYMTNPNTKSYVVYNDGKHVKGKTWTISDEGNGFITKNMMGAEGGRVLGITDPKNNYSPHVNGGLLVKAKDTDLPILADKKDGKLGTNAGGVYKAKGSNKFFYIKHDSHAGQNASEDLANKLYEAAGIAVPNTEIVKWGDGTALKSDWIDDATYHKPTDASGNYIEDGTGKEGIYGSPSKALLNRPEIKQGFLVDCVLANWDVAGAGPERRYGNLAEADGKVIRLDQGGALNFSGTGNPKPAFFTSHKNPKHNDYMDELDTLRNASLEGNHTTAHIFQDMSEDDWNTAAENLMRLTNGRIEDLVNDSAIKGPDKDTMIETLIARRDKALDWWIHNPDVVGTTGYTSLEDLHAKRNILRKALLKEDNAELYADKHTPLLWIDDEGKNADRLPRTAEDKAAADKHYEAVTKLKNDGLQRLLSKSGAKKD